MKGTALWSLALATLLISHSGARADSTSDSLAASIAKTDERFSGVSDTLKSLGSDIADLKKIKFSGFVQARYEYNDSSQTGITGGYDPTKNLNANNFYIRRSRVKFMVEPGKTSRYVFQLDASKNTVTLKDAYVDLMKTKKNNAFTLTVGQFNIPFGYEIGYSDTKNDFPERSQAEGVLFNGERDRGMNLTWVAPRILQFNVGLLQGYGIQDSKFTWFSPTKLKHVVARAKAKLGMIDIGVSAYHGTTLFPGSAAVPGSSAWYDANHNGVIDSGEVSTTDPKAAVASQIHDKNRVGSDAQLYLNLLPIGSTGFRAEYYGARDKGINERGCYLWISQSIYRKWAGAVRYDYWDPNTSSTSQNDATAILSLAAHYFWDNNVRLTAAYDIVRPLEGNSIFSTRPNYRKTNRFTMQFQFAI